MQRAMLSFPLIAALVTAGCSGSGGGAGLTTSAILDGNSPVVAGAGSEAPVVASDDPLARPTQVGWTVARAQKCGFNFDAPKMRASFLATEQQRGVTGDLLTKVEKSYDQTVATVRSNIAENADYCTDARSALIKADLQRHLAGDYASKLQDPKKKVAGGSFFEGWGYNEPDKFDSKTIWKDLQDKKDGIRR
jgi:hypothetical protein